MRGEESSQVMMGFGGERMGLDESQKWLGCLVREECEDTCLRILWQVLRVEEEREIEVQLREGVLWFHLKWLSLFSMHRGELTGRKDH